ncbi:MAG: AAA family ATPase [Candidatus Schekmanbacteria bacterium]|nr:AAA family ATPase [Candidatus Schekmanbacteria bacterium]
MSFSDPLPTAALYRRCDPESLPFRTTTELTDGDEIVGHERATEALRFGVGMRRPGFNLFALGSPGTGRHSLILRFLEARAATEPTQSDWCYVNNFAAQHQPIAIKLPAGKGAVFRRDMERLVDELRTVVPAALDTDEFRAKLQELENAFVDRRDEALDELQREARQRSIALLRTPAGYAFTPIREGQVLSPDEFAELPQHDQDAVKEVVADLQHKLQAILREIPKWRRENQRKARELTAQVTRTAVEHLIAELREAYADSPEIAAHLDAIEKVVIEQAGEFKQEEEATPSSPQEPGTAQPGSSLDRFRVNVIVDRTGASGAPVIYEDNPTLQNLVGRVEYLSLFGALVTNFTLIKAGALHRANGGYLMLDALKVLQEPYAWEALKRSLSAGSVKIESPGELLGLTSTVSLDPQPIPLSTKIVLIGDDRTYHFLSLFDPDFCKHFKVLADFDDSVDRNADTVLAYARFIAMLARRENLRAFDRGAVARVVEHASRLEEDAEKLTTRMRDIADLLLEADYWAAEAARDVVAEVDVKRAIQAQVRRSDRIRQESIEVMLRGLQFVETDGERIGQVNGLAVIDLGNFAFGHPSRITASVRIGEGDVIDIEREVKLAGSVHSKAVHILTAFLATRYAEHDPLAITASLAMEQSYGRVDGDSASLAETCALLSALGQIPIRQSLAITGSMDQFGRAQPIGGVNEKIEGFFDLCKARGLTGRHGVVIPKTNVSSLMLRHDVVEAVRNGQFNVYAVESLDEAVSLLTGLPAGERQDDGSYPPDTVNERVLARTSAFAVTMRELDTHGDDDSAHHAAETEKPENDAGDSQ